MMKAKINADGFLEIERAGKFKEQMCPKCKMKCGDWCPLFHEPSFGNGGEVMGLNICEGSFPTYKKDFIDERYKSTDKDQY